MSSPTGTNQLDRRRARRWAVAAAGATFLFCWTLSTHGKFSVSGDEPHYLMAAHSLLLDGDLDVANNYAAHDGQYFGQEALSMDLHARPTIRGRVRSVHGPGLSVLVAPVYAGALAVAARVPDEWLALARTHRGLFAYAIVSCAMTLITALAIGLLARALMALVSARTAAVAAVLVGLSPPVSSHAFLIFPEVVALAITALAVWVAVQPDEVLRSRSLIALAVALGALPWLHTKYLPYAAGLAACVVWLQREPLARLDARVRGVAAVTLALSWLACLIWTMRDWGSPAGPFATEGLPFSLAALTRGSAGLLADRRLGLIAFAPLYVVVPIAWWVTRRTTWPWLLPVALLAAPAAAFDHGWWGGFAPAARFLVPLMPIVAFVSVPALEARAVRTMVAVLLVPQLAIDAVIWQHPRDLWPARDGNRMLERLGAPGRCYASWLPDVLGPSYETAFGDIDGEADR
jgi:hypothetical protein